MYAHSIKNPHVIHFRREWRDDEYHLKHNVYRYLCCNCYTPEKATEDPSEVTCKNCLKMLDDMKK